VNNVASSATVSLLSYAYSLLGETEQGQAGGSGRGTPSGRRSRRGSGSSSGGGGGGGVKSCSSYSGYDGAEPLSNGVIYGRDPHDCHSDEGYSTATGHTRRGRRGESAASSRATSCEGGNEDTRNSSGPDGPGSSHGGEYGDEDKPMGGRLHRETLPPASQPDADQLTECGSEFDSALGDFDHLLGGQILEDEGGDGEGVDAGLEGEAKDTLGSVPWLRPRPMSALNKNQVSPLHLPGHPPERLYSIYRLIIDYNSRGGR